ncbi:hypothetical protein BH09ACT6_BH09ACT6_18650 [soil metagenome]
MTLSDIIQTAAVVAAVGAAIVALVISAKDRQTARDIAVDDRREALRQAHLMFELDALGRLAENRNRGGSADPQESSKLGAEALTLVGLIGPERIPAQWEHAQGDDGRLRKAWSDPAMPDFKKNAIETQLAVNTVLREIRESIARP